MEDAATEVNNARGGTRDRRRRGSMVLESITEAQMTSSSASPASASSIGVRPLREVSRSTKDLVARLAEIKEGQKSFDGKVAALESLSQTVAAFLAADGKSIEKLRCGQSADSYAISRLEEVLAQTMAEVIDMLREHQGALRTMSTDMEAVLDRLKHLEISLLVEDEQFLETLSSSKVASQRQQQVEQMAADLERQLQALTSSQFRQLARQSASSFVAKILLHKVVQSPQATGESGTARVGLEPATFSRIRRLTRDMDSETLLRLGAVKPATFPIPPNAKSSPSSSPQRLEKIAFVSEWPEPSPQDAKDGQLPSWTLEFRRALDVAAARYSASKGSPVKEYEDGEPPEDINAQESPSPRRTNGFHGKFLDLMPSHGLTTVEEENISVSEVEEVTPSATLDSPSQESVLGAELADQAQGQDVFALFRHHIRTAGSCAIAAEADCRLVEAELTRMSSRLDFQGQPLIGQLTDLAARLSELRTGLQTAEQTLARDPEATLAESPSRAGMRGGAILSRSLAEAREAPSAPIPTEATTATTAVDARMPSTIQASRQKPDELEDASGCASAAAASRLRSHTHVLPSATNTSDGSTWSKISQQMQRLQASRGTSASFKPLRTPGTTQNGVSPSYAERQREQQRRSRGATT